MGKNLKQQRRGKGSPRYRPPSHRYLGKIRYLPVEEASGKTGKIVDIVHAPGRTLPLAIVEFEDKKQLMIPFEGASVGQQISYGGEPMTGNILPLGSIPEGTFVYNIELRPGDGGKLCRAPGSAALIVAREPKCVLLLPSKAQIELDKRCRATIGIPAGGGRLEKPLMTAGQKYHKARAFGRIWPIVRGVAKNPVDHPFGGSAKPGKHKTVSPHMPPGRKVGSIGARKTGKKKK